jgi:hypothetical protein
MLIAVACEHGTPELAGPQLTTDLSRSSLPESESSPRSGALHVTKNCSEYRGNPGEFCTITSSNLAEIPVDSRVVYAGQLTDGKLDSDLILVPPGRGNSMAFGHVKLDLAEGRGSVTFSGGTGKFTHFHASLAVTPLPPDPADWQWDGRYSLNSRTSGPSGEKN